MAFSVPWLNSGFHSDLYCDIKSIPKLSDYLTTASVTAMQHSPVITPYSDVSNIPVLSPIKDDSPSPKPMDSSESNRFESSTDEAEMTPMSESTSLRFPASSAAETHYSNSRSFAARLCSQFIGNDDDWPENLWDEMYFTFDHPSVIESIYQVRLWREWRLEIRFGRLAS